MLQTKNTNIKLSAICVASFLYLQLLSYAYRSPAPCDATQDFNYTTGRILSVCAPVLLIIIFGLSFRERFVVTKKKWLLSAAVVMAVIGAALVFTAAVYVFLFPLLERNTSGVLYHLISYHDCHDDVSPSDLLTNISFATGEFICFKIALGIADRIAKKRLQAA
jgi:hypothetical protein